MNYIYIYLVGGWYAYPSEKWWTWSVGIIPNIWKKCSKPPTRCWCLMLLVVSIPLKSISQLGWWHSQYMEKNVPNHQSVYYTNPLIHANVHVVYDINRIHKMVTPKIIQVIRPCESWTYGMPWGLSHFRNPHIEKP